MTAALRALHPILVAAALLAAVLPAPLACCAGLASAHGGDCCATSAGDPAARNCCQGGDALEKSDSGPQPVLVRASGTPAIPVSVPEPADVPPRHAAEVRPSPEALYSLHSILLL